MRTKVCFQIFQIIYKPFTSAFPSPDPFALPSYAPSVAWSIGAAVRCWSRANHTNILNWKQTRPDGYIQIRDLRVQTFISEILPLYLLPRHLFQSHQGHTALLIICNNLCTLCFIALLCIQHDICNFWSYNSNRWNKSFSSEY